MTAVMDRIQINEAVGRIENICKFDPMDRGFVSHVSSASLIDVAERLLESHVVWIVTGFPILSAGIGENDGPPGAAVIAAALEMLGKKVTLITDPLSERLVESALLAIKCEAPIISVPQEDSAAYCKDLLEQATPDIILTIERPSKGQDGKFHNMRGLDISSMVSDTDLLLETQIATISIGDGGNECGMGNFCHEIALHVPHGEQIAAATCCSYPLVAGISNYYGWGIAGALSLLSGKLVLRDEDTQLAVLEAVAAAGGVDGTKGVVAPSVDGQPLSEYLAIYRKIIECLA